MGSALGGFIWNPTTRHILKREETDKQNDDNLTFLFEYRALLNSRVQTLITQLSNALASDLDVAMNSPNRKWNNDRPAMNGTSTNTTQDPGAARAAFNFMTGWFPINNTNGADTAAMVPTPAPGAVFGATFSSSNFSDDVNGTASFVTAQNTTVDALQIGALYSGNPSIRYINQSADDSNASPTTYTLTTTGTDTDNRLNDSFSGPSGMAAINANAKNLFQKVLFDAVSSIEYKAVLSSGLFRNLVVSASSSLPTGSQLQASFNLNWSGTQDAGTVLIGMDKMVAFYHS
jgi:hypothetical protein